MNLKERKQSGFVWWLAYKGTKDRVESRLPYKGTKGSIESRPGYKGTGRYLENDQGFDCWDVVIHNCIFCITVPLNHEHMGFNLH